MWNVILEELVHSEICKYLDSDTILKAVWITPYGCKYSQIKVQTIRLDPYKLNHIGIAAL